MSVIGTLVKSCGYQVIGNLPPAWQQDEHHSIENSLAVKYSSLLSYAIMGSN
jgi:hypothetical protein